MTFGILMEERNKGIIKKKMGAKEMCYLIAKKFDKPGCIAVEMPRGKHLADLVSSLGKELLDHDVQILTVSSMDAYGEYRPYKVLSSEREFINQAIAM